MDLREEKKKPFESQYRQKLPAPKDRIREAQQVDEELRLRANTAPQYEAYSGQAVSS